MRKRAAVTRREFLRTIMAGTASIVVASCGATPTSTPAPTATTAPKATSAPPPPTAVPAAPTATKAPAAPTAAPTAGAKAPQKPVVVAQGVEPPTLDPQFNESGAGANIQAQMFDYLINYDRNMNMVPDAAESFKMMPDNVTWQFKIKKGIKFWNGEPLDAKAVKFTFDRIGNADLRKQGLSDQYWNRVGYDHMDIVDDYTVNFVLKKPSLVFTVYTTFIPLLAPNYYSTHTIPETAIKPMGSGPWMFKEWAKDDHLTIVANPDYWQGKPQIDTIIFKPVPEPSTRMAMLQAGDADLIADLAPEDVARIQTDAKLRVSKAIGGRRVGFIIPTQIPAFKDRRVRLAMNYAVDFDAINKTILGGLAFGRMAVAANGDFWVDPSIKPYPYDPVQATQLLKDAGWDPNKEVVMYTPPGRYMKDREIGQAVAGYLTKVGMKATSQSMEWSVYTDKLNKSTFDMPFLLGNGSRFFGPDDLSVLFEAGTEGFEWQTNTEKGPQARKLLDELLQTFDEKKQQQLCYQIEQIWAEEAPWLMIWKQVAVFGVNKRIDWEGSGNTRIDFWLATDRDVRFTT